MPKFSDSTANKDKIRLSTYLQPDIFQNIGITQIFELQLEILERKLIKNRSFILISENFKSNYEILFEFNGVFFLHVQW